MALDPIQRAVRKTRIGGSDAPAVANRDPWRSPFDVWAGKTGRVPDFAGNAATALGTYLESGVLDWCEAELRTPISRDQQRVHPNDIMVASLDGLALAHDPPAVVEAKTVGLLARPRYFDAFGPPESDEVPEHILLQVHHQFAVLNAQEDLPDIQLALVPVLLVGRGFVLYRVPRTQALVDAIVETEERFHRDYIVTDTPPPDSLPSLDTLKLLRRDSDLPPVALDGALVQRWLDAKAAESTALAAKKEAEQALLATLGEAEAGTCVLGTLTYKETTRKGYVVEPTTYRTPRFTTKKKEAA